MRLASSRAPSQHLPKHRTLKIVAGVAASFIVLFGAVVLLLVANLITPQMALLMFVALLGLYVGFGVLIAVYRLVRGLE